MKRITLKSMVLSILLVMGAFVATGAGIPYYEYPDNSGKSFAPAEDLNIRDKNIGFTEFEKSKYNMRKKIPFKDVKSTANQIKDFQIKAATYSPHIHPDRQVYFLATVKETQDDLRLHYVVMDAETHKVFIERESYRQKKK